jgi:hypothetical protein
MKRPAFYAPTGTLLGDLWAVLHPPYTAWHLSYVVIGATLGDQLDLVVLAGTVLAFLLGTGLGAHALDELHSRPLRTELSDTVLRLIGYGGLLGAGGLAVAGAMLVSPWVMAWAAAGIGLAAGYALERPRWIHTDIGFGLAWGGFPILVGYFGQNGEVGVEAVVVAGAATLLSLTQRALSTPARLIRRRVGEAEVRLRSGEETELWGEERLLDTWEKPLHLLAWAMVALAAGFLIGRL